MNAHLNEDQIAEWLLGSANDDVIRHVENCDSCRADAESLRNSISVFRRLTHTAAEREPVFWMRQRTTIRERLPKRRCARLLRWAPLAAAALVLLAVFLFTRLPGLQQAASNDAADDTLLQEVANEVEQDYPTALGPAALISQERNSSLADSARR